jgi:A/G-specific adenine glycosylase
MVEIAEKLLSWYDQNARRMPWRGLTDPYAVWVSEIMLQQTRVETVVAYFERWMAHFPTLQALAEATEQEVLAQWEGLGYYSRARNLHKAARLMMKQHAGRLPQKRSELENLPGIGPYTSGAIASIAFGQTEATLDGNIRRVLSRVFAMRLPARSTEGEQQLWALARQALPEKRAGDYNQALMDLGATLCTPQKPACLVCPLAEACQARQLGIQESLPLLEKPAPIPHYIVTAAVIQQSGKVLIAQRPVDGLLGGLWEFPGGKVETGETLPEGLRREIREELGVEVAVGQPFGVYRHAYTHFKITLHAFLCTIIADEPTALQATALAWVRVDELPGYPMGKVDRMISKELAKPLI